MGNPSSSDLQPDLESKVGNRTNEIQTVLHAVQQRIVPFIQAADDDARYLALGQGLLIPSSTTTTHICSPSNDTKSGPNNYTSNVQRDCIQTPLTSRGQTPDESTANVGSSFRPVLVDKSRQTGNFNIQIPTEGGGIHSLLLEVDRVLASSVNTFAQGFMDKLYGASNAPSMAADLLLSTLNTNLHVKHVSPALSDIERQVAAELALLAGWSAETSYPFAGGVSQPGGSASNQLAVLIARSTMFPKTREFGNSGVPGGKQLIIFTSAHSHYSIQKAALMAGLGLSAVRKVPVNRLTGKMSVPALEKMIADSKATGIEQPFFVNATAGTTVLGSYDPIAEISTLARREGLWCHVDGSWGGSVLLSDNLQLGRMNGIEHADSFSVCPHKMLGVSVLCSFLIGRDVRLFKTANTLAAGYLFHSGDHDNETTALNLTDLADLTPQCGRRGDSLKLYLSWVYYGRNGYARLLEGAFSVAQEMVDTLATEPELFELVMDPEQSKVSCLQVCFFWRGPVGERVQSHEHLQNRKARSQVTVAICNGLVFRGFMIDYAPMIDMYCDNSDGTEKKDSDESGDDLKFIRVVINRDTARSTIHGLISAIKLVCAELDPSQVWVSGETQT